MSNQFVQLYMYMYMYYRYSIDTAVWRILDLIYTPVVDTAVLLNLVQLYATVRVAVPELLAVESFESLRFPACPLRS